MLETDRGQQTRMNKTENFVKPDGGTVCAGPNDCNHLPEAERGAFSDQARKQ
jgi:hypothetical protein